MRTRNLSLALVVSILAVSAPAQFLQLNSYGVNTGLFQIIKSDLNNDHKPDVVGIGRENGVFNVTALLGNGNGGFSSPVVSAITGINIAGPPPQAVADFNDDGIPDFAFIGTDPTTGAPALGIMLGKGNGSFEAPQETILPGIQSQGQLAGGMFTGNGKVDIVFVNESNIMVLPGKGNGAFGSPIISNISQITDCLAVADFNNDSKLDLTVGISVMLGNGDGTFQAPISVLDGGCNVAVADLNHDGNFDLITGSSGPVHVYLGNGSGHFTHFTRYNTGNHGGAIPASFAVADFNGDSKPDIAVLNGSEADVTVLLNKGNGTFKIGETFSGAGFNLVADNFSGNNKQDLATSSNGVSVFLGRGNGTFIDNLAENNTGNPSKAMVADFNNDHKLDLLTFDPAGAAQLGNGNGTFGTPVPLPESCRGNQAVNDDLVSVAIADFNNDHKMDLAVIIDNDSAFSGVGICLGNGDGTFGNATFYDLGIAHHSVVNGDFNHDGNMDLAVPDQGGVSILLGNGNGTFQSAIPTPLSASFPIFAAGDFNKDGKLDIAAITGNTITVLLGKGSGTFESPVTSSNTSAVFLTTGDLNKDGKLDLVTVNANNTISVLLGNGDGTFQLPRMFLDFGATEATLGDFNGDGILDIAFNEHTSLVDVLLGKGDGTFRPPAKFSTFSGTGWVAPGEFDSDSGLDLVDLTLRSGFSKLVVFLNTK